MMVKPLKLEAHSPKWAWKTIIFMAIIHISFLLGPVFYFTGHFPNFINPANLFVLGILSYITGCHGITFGYHRYFTHEGFKTSPVLEFYLAICGILACEGPIYEWVARHLTHHGESDKSADWHSPHKPTKSFWHSQMGWLLYDHSLTEKEKKIAAKLLKRPAVRFFKSKGLMIGLQLALALVLYSIGGAGMVYWGVFARLVLVYHTTWFVNSLSHMFGYVSYITGDLSKNNIIVAFLTYGEGWHNNHHAFPNSPKHGLKWWEIDVTWLHVWLLKKCGLVWNLKPIPTSS
jgi:sn-1 stearoyl-lipid 9-desaturase